MKLIRSYLLVGVLFLSCALLFFSVPPKTQAASLGFDVQTTGEAQSLGYYKFPIQPGHTKRIDFSIHNTQNRTITVNITPLNGLTNANGGQFLQYVDQQTLPSSWLTDGKRAMTRYLSGPDKITLSPGECRMIHFNVTAPKTIKVGTLIGALNFMQTGQKPATVKKGSAVISNRLGRVIGVQADFSKKGLGIIVSHAPKMMITAATPYVQVQLENQSPQIVRNIRVDYRVRQGKKRLFSANKRFKMAPKSAIGYPAPWAYKTFSAGKYTLDETIFVNGKKLNSRSYDFVVPKGDVLTYQRQSAARPVTTVNDTWWLVLILVLLLLGSWIFFIIWKRRKEKKESTTGRSDSSSEKVIGRND